MAEPGFGLTPDDPRAIRALFDNVAPTYDLLNRILSFGRDRLWRVHTARLVHPAPGSVVLDICGGTGDMAVELSRICPDCRVVLLDFAREMLRFALPKLDRGARVFPVSGDVCRLPLPDASCDGVTAGFGFRNLRNVGEGLAEVARVLRPGGRLAILELFRPDGPLATAKRLMLRALVPAAAWVVSPSRAPAYAYLAGSIIRFMTAPEMAEALQASGFGGIEIHRRMLGFLTIVEATRR